MHCWQGEWYAKGWGVEIHSRGNPGEGPDPQERQGATVGKGTDRGSGHYRKLLGPQCAHLPTGSQRAECTFPVTVLHTRRYGPACIHVSSWHLRPSHADSAAPSRIRSCRHPCTIPVPAPSPCGSSHTRIDLAMQALLQAPRTQAQPLWIQPCLHGPGPANTLECSRHICPAHIDPACQHLRTLPVPIPFPHGASPTR